MITQGVNYKSCTADAEIRATPGFYHGYTVTVVTATAAINILDGSTVIDVIPATTAAGTQRVLPVPIRTSDALSIDFTGAATGTVVVLFS